MDCYEQIWLIDGMGKILGDNIATYSEKEYIYKGIQGPER